MSDLIRRDEILDLYKVKEEYKDYSVPLPVVIQNIKDMPAVDAVEVVRCFQCLHRDEDSKICKHPKAIGWDAIEPEDDDFCSYGERREK